MERPLIIACFVVLTSCALLLFSTTFWKGLRSFKASSSIKVANIIPAIEIVGEHSKESGNSGHSSDNSSRHTSHQSSRSSSCESLSPPETDASSDADLETIDPLTPSPKAFPQLSAAETLNNNHSQSAINLNVPIDKPPVEPKIQATIAHIIEVEADHQPFVLPSETIDSSPHRLEHLSDRPRSISPNYTRIPSRSTSLSASRHSSFSPIEKNTFQNRKSPLSGSPVNVLDAEPHCFTISPQPTLGPSPSLTKSSHTTSKIPIPVNKKSIEKLSGLSSSDSSPVVDHAISISSDGWLSSTPASTEAVESPKDIIRSRSPTTPIPIKRTRFPLSIPARSSSIRSPTEMSSQKLAEESTNSPRLMPPPKRPARLPSSVNHATSLRIPSSGPLPNRNPNAASNTSTLLQSRSTLNVPPQPQNRGRQKVSLEPGHSPLDWAHLIATAPHSKLTGLSDAKLMRVTPSMLKQHNGRKDRPAWSSYYGRVYNITPYVSFHPGGKGEILRSAGKSGEKLFQEAHPWVSIEGMLEKCLVGVMVEEGDEEGMDGLD